MKKLSTRNTFADCTPQKDSEVEEALERNAVNESWLRKLLISRIIYFDISVTARFSASNGIKDTDEEKAF